MEHATHALGRGRGGLIELLLGCNEAQSLIDLYTDAV